MSWYLVWRMLHLVGAFGFIAAHGATATVTFKIRKERDPERIRALLDLSRSTRWFMHTSFLLLVGAGVGLGFAAGWWWTGWIWASIAILTVLFAAAFPLAVPYFRALRRELDRDPVDAKELDRLLRSQRGPLLAWIETIGILVILYLMVFKPF